MYFPVVQKTDSNLVMLRQITELLNNAVSTGEVDLLSNADTLKEEITNNIDSIITL